MDELATTIGHKAPPAANLSTVLLSQLSINGIPIRLEPGFQITKES
jgi:hypothetical protein